MLQIFKNLNFLDKFSKNTQISNFTKICPLLVELLRADGWTDVTKLIVAFRISARAPKILTFALTSHALEFTQFPHCFRIHLVPIYVYGYILR
jgi:hypothetical protein